MSKILKFDSSSIAANPFSPSEMIALEEQLRHEKLMRSCRADYYEYCVYSNVGFKRTRFHNFLCKKVQDFVETKTGHAYDILLLSVPPQHGKSLSVTETLPSWYLGKNPTHSIIVAGYSGDFVKRFGRRNLDKLSEFGKEVFGDAATLADSPCNTTEFELSNHKGRAMFAGITSGITGNPANLVILDDVIKNRTEAFSQVTKDAVVGEYLYSIKTRFAAGAKIIVIGTRWVEDDIIGWLEANEKFVTVINIPCECIDPENDPLGRSLGDALMPEIGKDRNWLADFKESYLKTDGATAWNAMFQGRPVAANGNMWLRDWWRFYDEAPDPKECTVAISVDATFKDSDGSDFCVIETVFKRNAEYYITDLIRARMGFVDTLRALRVKMKELGDDLDFVYIEDKANGSAIIDALSREFSGIIPVSPEGGKMARASAVSNLIETGRVFLPKYAAWVSDFLAETSAFPNGAHDDMVDATSQALNRLAIIDATFVPTKKRRIVKYSQDMLEDYDRATPEIEEELKRLWGYPAQYFGEQDDGDSQSYYSS